MKGKRIKVGIKDLKSVLDIVVRRETPLSGGGIVAEEKGTYFTSFEAFRKALTPKRLELLHIIKAQTPSSINELVRFAKRDVKNIADDVNYLEQIGLIQKKETASKTAPVITYDKIALEIAV